MNIIDKINELRKQVEELDKDVKEADIRQKHTVNTMKMILDVFSEKESRSIEYYKILLNLLKEMNVQELEWFRSNSAIIRKFSSESANELDKEITELENIYRHTVEEFDKFIKTLTLQTSLTFRNILDESTDKFLLLDKKIRLCKDCIKGTLDTIKRSKSNSA